MIEGDHVGAYRMQKQIGAGGMGEVWLAEHTLLGRRAAIKLLHPTYSNQPEIVARFFNEARAATAIADPGIVQIFDFGHDKGVAYIVMEMLDGETLEDRRHRGISVADALRVMRQVAGSLGAAHARGIIHRDLKPENIFLVRDPEVVGGERAKILDFGIAKLTGDSTVRTQTSAVMGTPMFMSPEQCRGAGQVDQRADIYSLGCVLFTLVAGRPVFMADGVGDLIVKHITETPPRLSSLVSVPPALDDLVARCLEKDPARRPGSGTALAALLGALLADAPERVTPVPGTHRAAETAVASWVAGAAAGAVQTTLSGSSVAIPTPPPPPRRRRGIAIASVGALVAGGVIAVAALGTSPKSAPRPVVHAAVATADASVAPSAPAPIPAPVDDRPARAVGQIGDVLASFVRWAPQHRGAPCPTIDDLSSSANDPWGHRLTITCTGQPDDQQIGVTSAGPDGATPSADDLHSWLLGADVASVAGGRRWVTTPTIAPAPPQRRPITKVAAPAPRVPVTKTIDHRPAEPVATVATTVPPNTPPTAAPVVTLPPVAPPKAPNTGSNGIIRVR